MDRSHPPRKTGRRRGRRAQIRAAAYRCIRDHGYHETSVDMICREAGISKGSLYWHYDSKQEIFADLVDTWANQVMEELYEQFEAATSDRDYLRAITGALRREIRRGRAVVPLWLEFAELARREPTIQVAVARFFRRARTAIADMMRPVLGGEMSEDEMRAIAAAIFGAYMGLLVQELADPDQADARRAIDHFMRWLERGLSALRPDGGEAPPGERLDPAELAAFLDRYDPGLRELVRAVRAEVLAACPAARERLVKPWRALAWECGRHRLLLRLEGDLARVVLPADIADEAIFEDLAPGGRIALRPGDDPPAGLIRAFAARALGSAGEE